MFDKATRMKLRFQTDRGQLNIEDVWDLNLTQLNNLAKSLRKRLKESEEEDFLNTKSEADATDKLRFDLVINILETKKLEKLEKENAAGIKAKQQQLLGLLAEKESENLRSMSAEEIKAELAKLGMPV